MSSLEKLKEVVNDKTILYIEKDENLQKNFGIYLKKTFKDFYQASDGLEGYNIYKKNKPDVILMDLSLDKKDAIELLADIQNEGYSGFIIVLSEYNENYSLLQSLDMGLSGVFLKPMSFSQLANNLIALLPKVTQQKVILNAKPVIFDKEIQKPAVEKQIEVKSAKVETTTLKELKEKPLEEKPKKIKTCMEDIKDYCDAKEEFILVNAYKGITIQNKGECFHCDLESFELKTTVAQIVAANYEKHTILKLMNQKQHIYADVAKINLKHNMIQLKNPRYIDYVQRDKTALRIVADKSFKASIFINKIHYEFTARQVSINSVVLYSSEPVNEFVPKMEVDVTLGFEIDSPSSLIKEKKFTKVFAKGTILRVDKTPNGYEIPLNIQIQKAGQSSYMKYLKERENEVIEELKKIIRR